MGILATDHMEQSFGRENLQTPRPNLVVSKFNRNVGDTETIKRIARADYDSISLPRSLLFLTYACSSYIEAAEPLLKRNGILRRGTG